MKKTLLTTAVLMAVAALPVQAKDVVAEKNWANKDVHYVTLQSAAGTLGAANATGFLLLK